MIACLICINFFAIVVGGTLAGFGIWMLHAGTSLFEILSSVDSTLGSGVSMEWLAEVADRKGILRTMAIATTIAGIAAMSTAMLGVVAVAQRIAILAILYKLAVLGMLTTHIAGTAFLLIKKPALESEMRVAMLKNQNKYFVARTSLFNRTNKLTQAFTNFFEHLHMSYECCGVVRTNDILNSSSFLRSVQYDSTYEAKVPVSCCKLKNKDKALSGKKPVLSNPDCPMSNNGTGMHKEPCFKSVRRFADKVLLPFLLVCGTYAIVLATALGMMAAEMCAGFSDSDSDSDYDSDSDAGFDD